MNWGQDLRHGARVLVRTPGFSLLAVLVLALGIGATTAIFTVFYAVLLKPLPYGDAERLFLVNETSGQSSGSASAPNLLDWRAQSTGFDFMAFEMGSRSLQDASAAERVRSCAVEASQFFILKSQPMLGRTFAADDSRAVLMSEWLWRKRYGAKPDVVGQTIQVDGEARRVIGVMPDSFEFPAVSRDPVGMWVPLEFPEAMRRSRSNHVYFVVARLRDGVTLAAAEDEMKAIARRLATLYPVEQGERGVRFVSLEADSRGSIAEPLYILLGAVGVVFLISGVNLANLLLARAASRAPEVAVRAALGATRGRLIVQFLMESLLLSAAGAAAGLLVAQNMLDVLLYFGANYLPRAGTISIHLPVLLFLIGLSVFTGLGFGLVPALRVSDTNLRRGVVGGSRLRRLLVSGQIALAFLLLIGAGLLFRTLWNLKNTTLGFETRNHIAMRLSLPQVRYNSSNSARFYAQLTERLRALPGVDSAGLINMLPLESWGFNGDFKIVGRPVAGVNENFAEYRFVTPGYFETMGIPVRAGRDFSWREPEGKLTRVIVNEKLAQRYFARQNPIGQKLEIESGTVQEIIGVVSNTRSISLDQDHVPEIYILTSQSPDPMWIANMSLVVSARMPAETLVQAIRGAVRELDAGLPVYNVRTLDEMVDASLGSRNLVFYLIVAFAALAMVLSMAGVYGVISYLVTARTREFGVRVALGASRVTVVQLVLRECGLLVGGGLLAGGIAASMLSSVLGSFLHGVSPEDPLTFVLVAAMTVVVAMVATALPAWRASRVDPMVALREL